jgi:hypothetical protein
MPIMWRGYYFIQLYVDRTRKGRLTIKIAFDSLLSIGLLILLRELLHSSQTYIHRWTVLRDALPPE